MPVGARHDEAVEPAPLQFRAQRGQPSGARRAFAVILERLQAGLEHRGNLLSALWPSNRPSRPAAMKTCGRRLCMQCNIKVYQAPPNYQAN